jgi:hypothetical protein
MRSTLDPVPWHHLRRVAHQVQRPRLRPVWRIAAVTAIAAGAALLVTGVAYVSANALAKHDVRAILAERQRAELAADQERARNAPRFDFDGCEIDHSFAQCEEWRRKQLEEEGARQARPCEQAEPRRIGCLKLSKECLENPLSKTCL